LLRADCCGGQPSAALLTADWNVLDHADEAQELNALVTRSCAISTR
jgi:hypothetical protein